MILTYFPGASQRGNEKDKSPERMPNHTGKMHINKTQVGRQQSPAGPQEHV